MLFCFIAAILTRLCPHAGHTNTGNVSAASCLGGMLPVRSSHISSRDVADAEAAHLLERTTDAIDSSKRKAKVVSVSRKKKQCYSSSFLVLLM